MDARKLTRSQDAKRAERYGGTLRFVCREGGGEEDAGREWSVDGQRDEVDARPVRDVGWRRDFRVE